MRKIVFSRKCSILHTSLVLKMNIMILLIANANIVIYLENKVNFWLELKLLSEDEKYQNKWSKIYKWIYVFTISNANAKNVALKMYWGMFLDWGHWCWGYCINDKNKCCENEQHSPSTWKTGNQKFRMSIQRKMYPWAFTFWTTSLIESNLWSSTCDIAQFVWD